VQEQNQNTSPRRKGADDPFAIVGGINFGSKSASGDSDRSNVIQTSEGNYVAGDIYSGGGDFVARDQLPVSEALAPLFESCRLQIEALPEERRDDKADLQAELQEIYRLVARGEGIEEEVLWRRLRNTGRIEPALQKRLVVGLAEPNSGIAPPVRLVVEKFKATLETA
jgi:phosphatidylserine/phosphatidylglycerophosphate/cardiolipin synthase-like enzyme